MTDCKRFIPNFSTALRNFLLKETDQFVNSTPLLKVRLFTIYSYLFDSLFSLESTR